MNSWYPDIRHLHCSKCLPILLLAYVVNFAA